MEEKKKGFFSRLVEGLKQNERILSLEWIPSSVASPAIDEEDFMRNWRRLLIMGDLGIQTTMSSWKIYEKSQRNRYQREPAECKQLLIRFHPGTDGPLARMPTRFENRKIRSARDWVNGVGKTTSVGKLGRPVKG